MNKYLLFAVAFFGLISYTSAQYDQKALEILNGMSEKYKKVPAFKAKFSYTLENTQENINEAFQGEILVKGEKFRLKMGGQEIINNGKTVWTYMSEVNEVNIDNYNPEDSDFTPTKIYSAYKKGYKYILVEDKTEGGNVVHVIDLIPEAKNAQLFKVRMEINKKDKSVKKWTIFDKNGNKNLYTVTLFDPNVKVTDNQFEFDKSKYKGVEVVDLR